jgi:hypothetical protein
MSKETVTVDRKDLLKLIDEVKRVTKDPEVFIVASGLEKALPKRVLITVEVSLDSGNMWLSHGFAPGSSIAEAIEDTLTHTEFQKHRFSSAKILDVTKV